MRAFAHHTNEQNERHHGKKQGSERIVKKLDAQLDLSDEQEAKIKAVFDDGRKEIEALHAEYWPKYEVLRKSHKGKILAVLTPEQKAKFEDIHARFEKKMKKRGHRMRPPPPPREGDSAP